VDIAADLRSYITGELRWSGSADQLTDDFPLVERDVIDSMGIFQLIEMIEARYDVTIDEDDIVLENFGSIGQIVRLVSARLA